MKTFKQYTKVRPVYHKHFIGKLSNAPKELNESVSRTENHRRKVLDKLSHELTQHANHKSLSDDHHYSWKRFARDSEPVNTPLHDNSKPHAHDKNLSDVIKKHKLHRNMTVYSGMRSPTHHPVENGHRHLHLPAYTSTSLSAVTAKSFACRAKDFEKTDMYWHISKKGRPSAHEQHEKFDPKNPEHVKSKQTKEKDPLTLDSLKHNGSWETYGHVAAIKTPKDSHGFYLGNSNDITRHTEHEYVLHKGAKVKLKEHPEVDHDSKIIIHHGVLTHDGVKPTRHDK